MQDRAERRKNMQSMLPEYRHAMTCRVRRSDEMESTGTPTTLQFALDEERRLEAALQSNQDFQQLAVVRRVIAMLRGPAASSVPNNNLVNPKPSEDAVRDARNASLEPAPRG